jgi:thiol-disulfide isomerase/thioredoxin
MSTEMKGLDGKTFALKDFKGKALLVNLWATWCGPCRMEMPELVKLETDYKDKGFMVIGLDADDSETPDQVKKFVEKQELNYKIGWAGSEMHGAFLSISQQSVIPQSFIITPDGKLAGIFRGYNPAKTPADVRSTLDEVLSRTSE